MTRLASRVLAALALILTVGSLTARGQVPGASTLSIAVSGLKAGTEVQVTAEIDGGAPVTGTVGGNGLLDMMAFKTAKGKPHVQLSVHIGDQCVDGKVYIAMVQSGVDAKTIPPKCRNREAGVFWLDSTQNLTINAQTAVLLISEPAVVDGATSSRSRKRSTMGKKTWIIVGTGVGAGTGIALAGGGSGKVPTGVTTVTTTGTGTTTPTTGTNPSPPPSTTPPPSNPAPPSISTAGGNYVVVVQVTTDANGHRTFVLFDSVTGLLITISGTNIQIVGAQPWVTVSGTIDLTTGRFTANGAGVVAGRQNVPVSVEGTIAFTDTGAIAPMAIQATTSFNIVVGGGGSLPGSVDDGKIRYSATGRRP